MYKTNRPERFITTQTISEIQSKYQLKQKVTNHSYIDEQQKQQLLVVIIFKRFLQLN